MPGTPRIWWTIWEGRVWISHLISTLLGGRVPPPASLLRDSPPEECSTHNSWFCRLGICPGDEGEGEVRMRHKPEVFGQAHATLISDQEVEIPEGSGCPRNQNVA